MVLHTYVMLGRETIGYVNTFDGASHSERVVTATELETIRRFCENNCPQPYNKQQSVTYYMPTDKVQIVARMINAARLV